MVQDCSQSVLLFCIVKGILQIQIIKEWTST